MASRSVLAPSSTTVITTTTLRHRAASHVQASQGSRLDFKLGYSLQQALRHGRLTAGRSADAGTCMAIDSSATGRADARSVNDTLDSINLLVTSGQDDFQALGAVTPASSPSDVDLFRPASGTAKPNVKRRVEQAADVSKGLPVSYALLGLNVILYSAGITHAMNHGVDAAQGWFGLFANSQLAVLEHHELYRLASGSVMHGSLLHLMATSLTLFNFAPAIEKKYGKGRFLAIYALSAVAGNAATLAVTDHAAVGASGALFGVAGALLAHQYKADKLAQPVQVALYLAGLVALNVVANYASNTFGFAAGNLGGFLTGAVAGLILAPEVVQKPKRRTGAGVRAE